MGKVLAILCARMTNSRFPGKSLQVLADRPNLEWCVERLRKAKSVGTIVVATSTDPEDVPIVHAAYKAGVPCFRGSLHNVMDRMWRAAMKHGNGEPYVFRAMSDQPLLDWMQLDEAVSIMQSRGWDFVLPLSFGEDPVYGAGVFPWSQRVFEALNGHSTGEELEHPGMWLRRNLARWNYGLRDLPHWTYRPYRLELDLERDLQLLRAVYRAWDGEGPPDLRWAVHWLDKHPEVAAMNSDIKEKTGTYTSFTKAEIESWYRDYAGRDVVWSDIAGLVGTIKEEKEAAFDCDKCGGPMVATGIKKGDLRTKCMRCGWRRTFYAVKPKS